jgi:hypothetical protein
MLSDLVIAHSSSDFEPKVKNVTIHNVQADLNRWAIAKTIPLASMT